MSRPVKTRKEKAQVGTISAHNDETVGELVADAMEKVGADGVNRGIENDRDVVEGIQFDRGFLSPYFVTDAERMKAVLEDAYILLSDRKQRPEIKDHFKNAALETLRAHSFADDELSRGYHGQGVFSLRNSRVQAVIADAVRWRMAQGKARSVTAKPLPPVQRPGVAQSRYDHASGEIASLTQRLGRTGNVKDAAKLLAAQRRAGR